MDFANVNTTPSFVTTPVATTVEKKDREAPQIKPVDASAESSKAALGNNELHRKENERQKTEDLMSPEVLAKMAEEIQGKLDQMGSTLEFSINDKAGSVVAVISNRESGEVIRQIPSEEILALREKLKEVVGLFFDEKL